MRTPLAFRLRPLVALVVLTATSTPTAAQTTYTWNGTTNEWLIASNWTGGPAGTWPGTATTDVARFVSNPVGPSSGIAINFGAAGGTLSLGAIEFAPGNATQVTIGNSSASTAGVLRLNGATVGGVPNVLIAETTGNGEAYFFQNAPQGSGGPGMTIQLGITNGVFMTPTSILRIDVPISEAAPGSGITVRGLAEFFGTNSYTGATRIEGGWLNIRADSGLGAAPSSPTPNHLVIQPAGGFAGTLKTNAATFEIHANRGIAIGPTTGTGDAVIEVLDPSVIGYTPTVTYNGVIANNGGGTGRLVLSGGGRLVLGGSNTFTGGALNSGGEFRLRNVNALGTTGTVTITPQGNNDFGPLPGNLMVETAGNFERPIVVNYGGTTIRPVTIGTPDFAAATGTTFSGAITLNRPATFQGGNSVQTRFGGLISGGGDLTITATAAGRMVVFAPPAFSAHSYGQLTIAQNATLQLDGVAGQPNRFIPDASSITFGTGARLNLNPQGGSDESVNALIGASGVIETVGGSSSNTFTLLIGAGNGSGSFGGTIQEGAGKSVVRLIKFGSGTQTFSGNNTYTGGTEVLQGTLLVNGQTGANSGTGNGAVSVNGGALGGNGRVAGGISVGPAGRLAPGIAGAGTLTVGGNVTIAGSSAFAGPGRMAVSVAAPGTNSSLTVQGAATTFNFGKDSALDVSRLGGFGAAGSYTLVTMPSGSGANVLLDGVATTNGQVLGTFVQGTGPTGPVRIVPSGFTLTAGDTFVLTRTGDAVVLNFTPVPEPVTVLGLAAGALGLGGLVRRRVWKKSGDGPTGRACRRGAA